MSHYGRFISDLLWGCFLNWPWKKKKKFKTRICAAKHRSVTEWQNSGDYAAISRDYGKSERKKNNKFSSILVQFSRVSRTCDSNWLLSGRILHSVYVSLMLLPSKCVDVSLVSLKNISRTTWLKIIIIVITFNFFFIKSRFKKHTFKSRNVDKIS